MTQLEHSYMASTNEGQVPFLRVGDFGSQSSNIYINTISAKGTTILHATSSLNHMVFLKPTETLLDMFEDTTEPVLHQILLLNDQKKQLSISCNILLPRLINGEVAI